MSKILLPNAGIASPNGPDVTVTITLDTKTNETQLLANRKLAKNVLVALLLNHAKSLADSIVIESMQATTKENGHAT